MRRVYPDMHMLGSKMFSFFISPDAVGLDWLMAAILVAINFTVPGYVLKPLERHFKLGDAGLAYPMTDVPLGEAVKFALIFTAPAAVAAMAQIWKRSWLDWHFMMLAVFEGFAIESTFKKWMTLVGRLRPDWLERLGTHDPATINEGRLSYPSGHAAETMMAATVLGFYLLAQMRLLSGGHRRGHFALALMALLPAAGAVAISMQRVTGYRHHFSDINAGMALGMVSGTLAYFLNYPSVFSADCDKPRGPSNMRSRHSRDWGHGHPRNDDGGGGGGLEPEGEGAGGREGVRVLLIPGSHM